MVCYTIPTIVAIVHYVMRRNVNSWKKSVHHFWLSLLLVGGAIFGVVDHWWNNELFLIGEAPLMDIMLGVVITIAIFVIWVIIITLNKTELQKPTRQTES